MLKPKYIERLPDRMIELYSQAEMDILADMARRISTYDYFIPAAQWQYRKLIDMGNYHSHILKSLSSLTGRSQAEIRRLMEEAGQKALAFDDSIYRKAGLDLPPLATSPALQMVLKAGVTKTSGLFANLTSTTARTATQQFEQVLDQVYMQVTSGAFDANTAIRYAIKDLSRQGLASIRYSTGHTDYLETAVRRAVVTGVNQTAAQLTEARADQAGCDLVETTAHAGARPEHAVWQGKVFSRSGRHPKYPDFVVSTGYGTGPGLCGWNCRHSFFPYYEGVSEPAYSAEQLKEMDAKSYEYNGQKLTEYEATQQQRHIERQIRRWKRENLATDAAGQDTMESAAKIKLWQDRQQDFLRQTGLKRQTDREQIAGFGRSEAARATAAAKRPTLTNAVGQRIIKVNHTTVKGTPNSITQRSNAAGGVDRNYYGTDGRQIKQISNNHHGHKAVKGYGENGEHAHDYLYDEEGKLTSRPYRELTEDERKENKDIL